MWIVFFEHEKCLLNPIFMKQKLLEGDGALDKDYRFTFKSNQLERFIYQKYYRFYVPMPPKQATCFPLKPLKKFSLPTNYRKGCTVILSILLFVFRFGFHSKCRYTLSDKRWGLIWIKDFAQTMQKVSSSNYGNSNATQTSAPFLTETRIIRQRDIS